MNIVWQDTFGNIRVTIPADPDADLQKVAEHALSVDESLRSCTNLGSMPVPTSRRFRNCWVVDNFSVVVDLTKARNQILSEIRAERDVQLATSDNLKMQLMDTGTPKQLEELAKYRQVLRDMPAKVAIDLALLSTADQLEKYQVTFPAPSV